MRFSVGIAIAATNDYNRGVTIIRTSKMKKLIIDNKAFLVSESAISRIESIVRQDLLQQEINYNFLNPEEQTYNNPLIPSDLPQQKSLLFSKNK